MKTYICGGEVYNVVDKEGVEYRLTIKADDTGDSPRDWDNLGTMVCWHRHYSLGDNNGYKKPADFLQDLVHKYVPTMEHDRDLENLDMASCLELLETAPIATLPLYLYDHSGITMSTNDFGDRWDSGQVGWIYVDKETILRETLGYVLDEHGERIRVEYKHEGQPSTYGCETRKLTDATWQARAEEVLRDEVKTYDQYLRGEVYGYILERKEIDEDGEEEYVDEDSCWGFYTDTLEDLLSEIGMGLRVAA